MIDAAIQIRRIAPLSSVQAGEREWRSAGVPPSGPMDDFSHAVANVLVGNRPDTAALEIGFGHTEIAFSEATLVAITGARVEARSNGVRVPGWRPLLIAADSTLTLGPASAGRFAYLAVAGGIVSDIWLGSQSATVHGTGPRALKARDRLDFHASRLPAAFGQSVPPRGAPARIANWWADAEGLIDVFGEAPLRLMPGTHVPLLADRNALFGRTFTLAPTANRMAALLDGEPIAARQVDTLFGTRTHGPQASASLFGTRTHGPQASASLFGTRTHGPPASDSPFGTRTHGPPASASKLEYADHGSAYQRQSQTHTSELISEPVTPGTVQLLPSGKPVVLLREAGVTGGYPRIAHLASIDIARLAQRPPGSAVRFESISVGTAQWLWRWRRQRIARLAIAARARLGL